MTELEKLVADYTGAENALREQLIAPVKATGNKDAIRELVVEIGGRCGAVSFWSEGESVTCLRLSEIPEVKKLMVRLMKTA